jgi:hypothetical protein
LCIGRRIANASAQASSGPAMRSIVVSHWFDYSKTRGAAERCHRKTLKENLSPDFGVAGIFDGPSLRHAQ